MREKAAKAAVSASGRGQPQAESHAPRNAIKASGVGASRGASPDNVAHDKEESASATAHINDKAVDQVKIVAARPKTAPKRTAVQTKSSEPAKVPAKPTATKAASPVTPAPQLPKPAVAVVEPVGTATKGDDDESEYTSYTDDSEYTSGESEESEEEKEVEPEGEDEDAADSQAPVKR